MKRYKIQDVKLGMNNGYGPFPGTVTVSINYDDGTGSKWLSGSECDGCIDFYLSDRDINGILSSSHMTDEDVEVVESAHIDELDGFELGNYDVVLENIEDNPDHPVARLVKYLVLLVVCQMDDFEGYAEMGKGRFIDEVDVPDIDDEFRGARDPGFPDLLHRQSYRFRNPLLFSSSVLIVVVVEVILVSEFLFDVLHLVLLKGSVVLPGISIVFSGGRRSCRRGLRRRGRPGRWLCP